MRHQLLRCDEASFALNQSLSTHTTAHKPSAATAAVAAPADASATTATTPC